MQNNGEKQKRCFLTNADQVKLAIWCSNNQERLKGLYLDECYAAASAEASLSRPCVMGHVKKTLKELGIKWKRKNRPERSPRKPYTTTNSRIPEVLNSLGFLRLKIESLEAKIESLLSNRAELSSWEAVAVD